MFLGQSEFPEKIHYLRFVTLLRRELPMSRRHTSNTVAAGAFCAVSAFAFAGSLFVVTNGADAHAGISSATASPNSIIAASASQFTERIDAALVSNSTEATAATEGEPETAASELSAFVVQGPSEVPSDWAGQAQSLANEAEATLTAHTDAKLELETALVSTIERLRSTDAEHFNDAKAAMTAARDAVVADAQAFRAWVSSEASGSWQQPNGADINAQLNYLRTYAVDYNVAEFGDFNNVGGDCANFVSQGLLARGWVMDETWASYGQWDASSAWVYVPAMDDYFATLGIPTSGLDNIDRLRVGDVGVFDWGEDGTGRDHVMTVSRVDYTPDGPVVYFASHNSDGAERELMYSLYEEHSDSTAWFYHLPG